MSIKVVNRGMPIIGGSANLITKTITANGTYFASNDNADGYSQVIVNVPMQTPTLFAPTLSMSSGYAPRAQNNSNNGAFADGLTFTTNNQTYTIERNQSWQNLNNQFEVWLFDKFTLAGGTQSISAYAYSIQGMNNSSSATSNYTWVSATETTGYMSVSGLGNQSSTSQVYTYDSNFPRSFEEVQDTYGNVFIKIPKMYRKVLSSTDGQITGFAIATSQLDSSYEVYPCFIDRTNNNAILPYILIGKYCTSSNSTANSVKASPTSMNQHTGRTACRNRGTGYQMYDWQIQKLFTDLGLVISRMVNIERGHPLHEIMGIAHQQQNIWVDGVVKGSSDDAQQWYICYDPDDYQNAGGGTSTSTTASESQILSNGYVKVGYKSPSANEYIGKLGYDTNNPFFNYPDSTRVSVGSNTNYYCDNFTFGSGSRPVFCLVGAADGGYGWFGCFSSVGWAGTGSVRLCYRPILNATGYVEP